MVRLVNGARVLTGAQRLDHQCNILGVRIGCDAMAKVEDVRAAGKGAGDAAGFRHEGVSAGDHMFRGEVALNAAVDLNVCGGPIGIDGLVEGDAVGPGRGVGLGVAVTSAARESDDWDGRGVLTLVEVMIRRMGVSE